MPKYEARLARLEQQVGPGFVVIVRGDDETDEASWQRYLIRSDHAADTPLPAGRVVFVSEADARA